MFQNFMNEHDIYIREDIDFPPILPSTDRNDS